MSTIVDKFYQIYNTTENGGTGLTNQLFSLLNIACNQKNANVYINGFLTQFDDLNSATDISTIIDLDYLNTHLAHKNVKIYDSLNKFLIKVTHIKIDEYDITNYFDLQPLSQVYINSTVLKKEFYTNDNSTIYIIFDILYNQEPFKTNLTLKSTVNNNVKISTFTHLYYNKVTPSNTREFQDLLLAIKFKHTLNNPINLQFSSVNIIHLKIEPDSIEHYSKIAKISVDEFEELLVKKYTELFDKNIQSHPNEISILISSTINSKIIEYLNKKHINYYIQPKEYDKRELNAIQDYLLATNYCNGVFICAWDPKTASGSTFSYFIAKTLKKVCRRIVYFTPDFLCHGPQKRAHGFRIKN